MTANNARDSESESEWKLPDAPSPIEPLGSWTKDHKTLGIIVEAKDVQAINTYAARLRAIAEEEHKARVEENTYTTGLETVREQQSARIIELGEQAIQREAVIERLQAENAEFLHFVTKVSTSDLSFGCSQANIQRHAKAFLSTEHFGRALLERCADRDAAVARAEAAEAESGSWRRTAERCQSEADALRAEVERANAKIRAANRLADEVAVLIGRKVIDSRSPAGDALLDYREPPTSSRSDRLAVLEAEVERLRAAARRWYNADGTFNELEPDQVIERRKQAARDLAAAREAADVDNAILSQRSKDDRLMTATITAQFMDAAGFDSTVTWTNPVQQVREAFAALRAEHQPCYTCDECHQSINGEPHKVEELDNVDPTDDQVRIWCAACWKAEENAGYSLELHEENQQLQSDLAAAREALKTIAYLPQAWSNQSSYSGGETNAAFAERLKGIARAALAPASGSTPEDKFWNDVVMPLAPEILKGIASAASGDSAPEGKK